MHIRVQICLSLLLLALFAARPAESFNMHKLSMDQKRQLAAGRVLTSVALDENSSVVIVAAVDIPANRQRVWQVMTNCARSPEYVPYLRSCRVLKKSGDGRSDVRELVGSWGLLLPSIRSVIHSRYERPGRIRFTRIAGDFSQLSGEWQLQAISGNRGTRVTYRARVAMSTSLPAALIREQIAADVPKVMTALRIESANNSSKF